MRNITWQECEQAAWETAARLRSLLDTGTQSVRLFGVPRGGFIPAVMVRQCLKENGVDAEITENPNEASAFVDDLVDSGATMMRYKALYPRKPFVPFFTKCEADGWLQFPWEAGDPTAACPNSDQSGHDIFTRLLQFIEEEPSRGGLIETPARAAKAWREWTQGYHEEPADVLKTFDDGASDYDQMVVVRDIPIYSHCEHHLAAIFGTASIAYVPNGKIVGLSKLNRLANIYARRLQVQERLTTQIADAIDEHLQPVGVGVVLRCRHLCMESRGVCQQGHITVTSALRGALRDQPDSRAEFFKLIEV